MAGGFELVVRAPRMVIATGTAGWWPPAAGGITTIVDMPLNLVPPTLDALEATREAARDRLHVDVGAETCPHYLTFDAGTILDGATQFKCCPPERKRLDSGDFGAA